MSKSLYELGEVPPLGEVPQRMYASVIRPERYGEPVKAFRTETVDVPAVGRGQVLVYVMAAGINYNNVWAASGRPLDVVAMRQKFGLPEDFHIGGSEGAGVVWAVGPGVKNVRPGDHVVLSGGQWDETSDDIRLSGEPPFSDTALAWGYETNYGSFAQFCLVNEVQCHPKPKRLSWEEAACFMLSGPTAYRQLFGWQGNTVRPGDPVLIWGGAGGLGSMAIQLVRMVGGIPIAVVSSDDRAEYCLRLGARGVINRNEFQHWGRLPDADDEEAMAQFLRGARTFGKRVWEILGERRAPKIVFEHSGQATLPTSMYVCANGGMVVICGGTSGYNGDVDLRHLWMRSKRLQGSHGANTREFREVTRLVDEGVLDPCLTHCDDFERVGRLHQMMLDNTHRGNMSVLVNAPERGMTSLPA
ncbi:crotonyl-CoA carboxylase/reductase [Streptomyces sp. SID4946]|uniref:crotonyl-CoA carboxylase/reductase n=1 Tax=Streptomyces TaxID=1883 RepID=UPI00081D3ABE|nr:MULTISPECIES: crotonyl-CoA carboxylase/reductase [unclassified Streptomyces]MYQ96607.1 crotonyl-CoA carboxylase/reductase [Streptomyces sp. SID4946]SCG01274.1 crotonyl-CoA carboxylase/reductase [Streptomyces sp. DconLS]SCG05649.1 crotonyl-CoA carboxylase/reductase [Streptomyces sp. LamerLS-31b]